MPSTRILNITGGQIDYQLGDRVDRIELADFPSGSEGKTAVAWQELIQSQIDRRRLVSDLPDEDPDKAATPAEITAEYGARMFKERVQGKWWLVSRPEIVSVVWDGTAYQVKVSNSG